MKKRKVLAMLLTVVLGAGTLFGCGQNANEQAAAEPAAESQTQTTESKAETQAEQAKEDEEPVTIEWLAYNCYAQPDPESELVKKVEEEFNVKFDFWYVDDQNWDEVLSTKLSGGDMPDIMRVKNTANVSSYVVQGILAPITDEILEKIPTYVEITQKYDPDNTGFIDSCYEGQQYVLKAPSLNGARPTVLVWRKDWLEKVGIEKIPSIIEEFETAIRAFKEQDPDGNGKNDTFGFSNTVMNAIFGAYGAIPMKEFRGTGTQNLFYTMKDGKVEFACVQPEMKEALAKLREWYKEGLIDPEFITGENKSGYWAVSQDFDNSKVGVTGMSMANHWEPPLTEGATGGACYVSFTEANPDAVWEETFDIGPSIKGPEGKSGTHCWGAYGTSGFAFTTKCMEDPRKVDAICAILERGLSDFDFYVLGTYGVEGEHFKINDDGIYVGLEPYTGSGEGTKAGLVFVPLINPEFQMKTNPVDNEFAEKYKNTGYSDVLVPPTEAADEYLTDLKTYTLDSYIKIITGEEDIDFFDEYVEEFNSTGGQQIIDEINEMMNAGK